MLICSVVSHTKSNKIQPFGNGGKNTRAIFFSLSLSLSLSLAESRLFQSSFFRVCLLNASACGSTSLLALWIDCFVWSPSSCGLGDLSSPTRLAFFFLFFFFQGCCLVPPAVCVSTCQSQCAATSCLPDMMFPFD